MDSANSLIDWFREWHQPLRRFLLQRQVGSEADIDDIAQEVFLRLLRYDRSNLVGHPQAYIYKIATNISAEWATRSGRSMPHSAEWLSGLVDAFDPQTELEHQALGAELRRALAALPPRSLEIVRLHFGEGLTHDNIAKRLSVTRRMVKRDLARAYAIMRLVFDPDLIKDHASVETTSWNSFWAGTTEAQLASPGLESAPTDHRNRLHDSARTYLSPSK